MSISLLYPSLPTYEDILKRCPDFFERAVDSKEAAAILDTTTPALAQMRTRGTGPKYRRLPTKTRMDCRGRPRGPIRYIRRDLIDWLREQHHHSNTAEEIK